MADIASKVTCSIDFSGGNFKLKRVEKGKVKHDGEVAVVLAVGVDGGAGFRRATGGGEITLDVYCEAGQAEVDWMALHLSRELFQFVVQVEGTGRRRQYRSCTVAAIPENSFDSKGEVMDAVTIKFLQSGTL